jgi:hypothetical protein
MRFYEFADAQGQLTLLRTIMDNTWAAIAQQAQAEKTAQTKANQNLTTGSSRPPKKSSGTKKPLPIPKTKNVPTSTKPQPKPQSANRPSQLTQGRSTAAGSKGNKTFDGKSHTYDGDRAF